MRTAAEDGAEVVCQRPHVKTSGADDFETNEPILQPQQRQLADGDRDGREGRRLVLARQLVGRDAVHLLCRVGRRHLLEGSAESSEGRFDLVSVDSRSRRWRPAGGQPCGRIIGIGRAPEPHAGFVDLVVRRQESREARRAPDHERKYAGRHRVERAGVPDAFLTERTPRPRHDVVRCRAERLVDDEDAIQGVGHINFQTPTSNSQEPPTSNLELGVGSWKLGVDRRPQA